MTAHFILDCDDVLLDWIGTFSRWLHANRQVTVPFATPSSWSLAQWLGISDDYCRRLVEEFNSSGWFGMLGPMPGAFETVRALVEAGHAITVLTSCSDDPEVVRRRRQNLDTVFDGACHNVICLGLGESKERWLRALRPGIWVEDNYKNALMGHNSGHLTYVVRRPHNRADEPQSDPAITWIDSLHPEFHF